MSLCPSEDVKKTFKWNKTTCLVKLTYTKINYECHAHGSIVQCTCTN